MSIVQKEDTHHARQMLLRQIVTIPLRFGRAMLVLPLLTPVLNFQIKVITTWLSYVPRITLGTHAILLFYYPALEKKGATEEAKQLFYLSWLFTCLGALVGALVGSAISIYYFAGAYFPILVAWGALVVPGSYVLSGLQAKGLFTKLATNDMIAAATGFVIPFVFLYFFGFQGYLVGLVISSLVSVLMGWSLFFPEKTTLSLDYLKQKLYDGSNFWANGFLADLVKSYEVSLFVMLPFATKSYYGQYAVAMNLAGISDQIMTSFSGVYQRKVVMALSETDRAEDVSLIYDFAALDMITFLFASIPLLAGTHGIVYLFPQYSQMLEIVPLLFLANYFLRFRFYPGVVFKSANQYKEIHLGHIVHLAFGVAATTLFSFYALALLPAAQVIGGLLSSTLVWIWLLREKQGSGKKAFLIKMIQQFALMILWIACVLATTQHLFINLFIVLVGGTLILGVSKWIFPKAFDMFLELFSKFKK